MSSIRVSEVGAVRKAFDHIGELLKRFGGRLTPSGCALRVPEAKRGRVPCDGAEEGCRRKPHEIGWAEPAKDGEGDSPLPLQFVIPVSRTQALPLLNRARVFYLRGGGMVPSVVTSGTRSGASVFSGSALRVPEAKRGRVPCDGAEEIYGAPPPEQTQVS